MSDLYFDEELHRYYLNGEELPSVTRILKPLNDFYGIPPEVLQHAADRGTAIHKAIELYVQGTLDEDSLCDEIKPYFAGFKKFVAEKQPKFVMSEQRVYHPDMRYAGCLDLALKMPSLYVIDVKNTAAISPSWAIQLLAYQEAAIACPDTWTTSTEELGCANRAVLWLKNTGKYQLVSFAKKDYARDLALFKTLLNAVHAEAKMHKAVEQGTRTKAK